MATTATRLRPDRRKLRRLTRAVSTVAIAAGLMLGAGALSSAPAAASEHAGTDDGTVSIQAFAGPFAFWDYCQMDRQAAQYQGYDVTPCFRDPDGWYYQYF
ncbi:hypothetical protein [Glycomyces buryatensis]|uniref:Uncharacterized protein n=1 Tax=Glycomyces buryatensis TaxID=2570927 RepID=A0A4S8QIK8_9ACTN|nr:hypothetical protein [Glycomyces buryatensis]THV41219.1 hypothetical protein FAB82_12745 [Glycomyces buryatensis]